LGVLIAGSPAVNQVHPSSPGFDVGLLWNQADILVCIGACDSDPAGIPEHPVGVPITATQVAEGRESSRNVAVGIQYLSGNHHVSVAPQQQQLLLLLLLLLALVPWV
jgi:hypothetical protein